MNNLAIRKSGVRQQGRFRVFSLFLFQRIHSKKKKKKMLSSLHANRQRRRAQEQAALEKTWAEAEHSFVSAGEDVHTQLVASCEPLLDGQREVAAAASELHAQTVSLQSTMQVWTSMLGQLDSALMELGDLEHYTAVLARQAEVVSESVTLIADKRTGTQTTSPSE
ncbi:hypothetical protein BC828DRAFT_281070 [Blastocladiella britannica]|nr:hypothetical protein BC828DRAFT_281070 [Blastocladiella britannica]